MSEIEYRWVDREIDPYITYPKIPETWLPRDVSIDCMEILKKRAGIVPLDRIIGKRLEEPLTSKINQDYYQDTKYLIQKNIDRGLMVLIWGDYDVDGMTATASLYYTFRALDIDCMWHLPSRIDTGYGLDPSTIYEITNARPCLIITVDNGVNAREDIAQLQDKGYTVIVTDHHIPEVGKQPVCHILDFKHTSDTTNAEYMAPGVYIAAKLAWQFAKELDDEAKKKDILDTLRMYVALGIVSDMIELNEYMWYQLRIGITKLSATTHMGIRSLFEICAVRPNQPITSHLLSFTILPKLNAAGRMNKASLGVDLLLKKTDDTGGGLASKLLANNLKNLNSDRKIIENQIYSEAEDIIESQLSKYPYSIVVWKDDWYEGVVGIIASRIQEKYARPCIVLARHDSDTYIGSGRAIPGFDLLESLQKTSRYLETFGGHTAAAGVTIAKSQLEAFRQAFDDTVRDTQIPDTIDILVDGDISIEDTFLVSFQVFNMFIEPHGNNHPELVYRVKNALVEKLLPKRDTLRLLISQRLSRGNYVSMLVERFRAPTSYMSLEGQICDFLISPVAVYFSGSTSVEWIIKDVHPH